MTQEAYDEYLAGINRRFEERGYGDRLSAAIADRDASEVKHIVHNELGTIPDFIEMEILTLAEGISLLVTFNALSGGQFHTHLNERGWLVYTYPWEQENNYDN